MSLKNIFFASLFLGAVPFLGCQGTKKAIKNFNLLSIEDDIALGKKVDAQIKSDPEKFPILPEAGHQKIYNYIRGIKNKIINSGKVKYKKEFEWKVTIIKDDKTLNAFCTPGGYIYVYTGLIKFLDSEDQLAGVLGHEIAHADLRHSSRQLTKLYGIQILTAIITGKEEPGMLEQVALGLVSLRFSRDHETEADINSVVYLCPTSYNAAGAAGFFEKMKDQPTPPEFLSTHPSPKSRIKNIKDKKTALNCKGTKTNKALYAKMKSEI